jgi:hypothetical protein
VHDAGIKLNDPAFVGQATISNGHVIWIFLHDIHASDHGIERIRPYSQQFHRLVSGAKAVGTRNRDRHSFQ